MPDVSVNIPNAAIDRLKAAMDEVLGEQIAAIAADPANPTNAEYLAVLQDYIVRDLRQLVKNAEREIARRVATPNPDEIEIS